MRLSIPKRIYNKWDDNIKHYEDLRKSANLSSTQENTLLYSDISMRKTYENSLRKTMAASDMNNYIDVYNDPMRRSYNTSGNKMRQFMTSAKK